ncbi:MAG: hypothetical protein Unbinned5179contig1004_4 [Prokaryotic dsDNA virus sp.]|nr:MAG: hypothetical protein Unbinned5179contig1004_4 [Prokaryotic dsDNA virus sp.]|tara:strand:- start:6384 stop:6653 length:270 start_codon:yes stop_codon:yes gene_type:complete
MSKLQTTKEQSNNDEMILIAHLSREFMRDPKEVVEDWNNGNILCWDWAGVVEWYQGFEDLLDGTIEEAIRFDLEKGILVKIQSLFFMYG